MNIYEYAMKMEKDGEAYYRDLASKTTNKGLITILTLLADEEAVHYKTLEQMKAEDPDADMANAAVLTKAKNVFESMKGGDADAFNIGSAQVDMYKKAAEIEDGAATFYEEKAAEMDNAKYKELFLQLAEEEKKHAHLLENIVEFVARPQQWVEDAEFSNIENY
ncbi:MAG: ferritin family protein [Fibrobacterales bacterium]